MQASPLPTPLYSLSYRDTVVSLKLLSNHACRGIVSALFVCFFSIQAVVMFLDVVAGRTYRPHAADIGCHGLLATLCIENNANRAAIITRCVAISLAGVWHMILVFQGLRDMARMPVDSFR